MRTFAARLSLPFEQDDIGVAQKLAARRATQQRPSLGQGTKQAHLSLPLRIGLYLFYQ
jgi:hypothetical protein